MGRVWFGGGSFGARRFSPWAHLASPGLVELVRCNTHQAINTSNHCATSYTAAAGAAGKLRAHRTSYPPERDPPSGHPAPPISRCIWIGHHSLIRTKCCFSPRWPCLGQASVYTLCGSRSSPFASRSDGSIQQASATSCSMRASNARVSSPLCSDWRLWFSATCNLRAVLLLINKVVPAYNTCARSVQAPSKQR